jgi:tetratricopeptide (TPR) repeat protein
MAEVKDSKKRRYPRIKVPKGMFVGWKSPGHRTVSRANELGLGGIFLYTQKTADFGAMIELVFNVPSGEVRARAIVRYVNPSIGMGLEFVQMRPEDRGRLHRYLAEQLEGSQPEPPDSNPGPHAEVETRSAKKPLEAVRASETETPSLAYEIERLLKIAQQGTYYQLLGVSADCNPALVKKNFYAMARKFHPDHHMDEGNLVKPLQHLMDVLTLAYKTLSDYDQRMAYDKSLASSGAFNFSRETTETRDTLDDCFRRATEFLRARNFVGSVTWLRKCVELAPQDAKYRAALARSLGTVPLYQNEAIQHFEAAMGLDPFNLKIQLRYAELCEEMGLYTRARKLYSGVLAVDPTHAQALERLAALESSEKTAQPSGFSRFFSDKA